MGGPASACKEIVVPGAFARWSSIPILHGREAFRRHCPTGATDKAVCGGRGLQGYWRPEEQLPIPCLRKQPTSICRTERSRDSRRRDPDPSYRDTPSWVECTSPSGGSF